MRCEHCSGVVEPSFRFCPFCARPLRVKLVEHFRAHPLIETEPGGLRVSRYLTGTRHVRFSIWSREGVTGVISLEEREARRLAAFLQSGSPASGRRARGRLPAGLRDRNVRAARAPRASVEGNVPLAEETTLG